MGYHSGDGTNEDRGWEASTGRWRREAGACEPGTQPAAKYRMAVMFVMLVVSDQLVVMAVAPVVNTMW